MCGIAGLIGTTPPGVIESMTDLLAHRGPDDRGTWVEPLDSKHVMLGSRRLAIQDLSPSGHMPMRSQDGRYVIVFNGEIYNHIELRATLESLGDSFRSTGDTEVLLAAYARWGAGSLEKLNGMFAIAIWDRESRELFLARDRLGVKPLYYCSEGNNFRFASEIKALYGDPDFVPAIDSGALYASLMLQYSPWPDTVFESVKKLPPGHYGIFRNNRFQISRYWAATDALDRAPASDDEVVDLLHSAVDIRLRSDVPVGTFLSGGIDSTIIAAITRKSEPRISAYTVGFDTGGTRYDETALAAETAKALDIKQEMVWCTEENFVELLPTLVWHLDEPIGENLSYPFFELSRSAKNDFTVALSGEGADECFYGYRYYTLERMRKFVATLLFGRLFKGSLSERQDRGSSSNKLRALEYVLQDDVSSAFWSWATAYFSKSQLRELTNMGSGSLDHVLEHMTAASSAPLQTSSMDVSPLLDLHFRMSDYLLTVRDKMTMAASLELRCPFLDYRVVEAGLSIPAREKIGLRSTKKTLRRAVASLIPAEVTARHKKPFSSPIPFWINGLVDRYLRDSECARDGIVDQAQIQRWTQIDQSGRAVNPNKAFNLIVLELWYRLFITRSLQPDSRTKQADNSAILLWNGGPGTQTG
jgi:asparagine synthase (glutamine-hydrolysing)